MCLRIPLYEVPHQNRVNNRRNAVKRRSRWMQNGVRRSRARESDHRRYGTPKSAPLPNLRLGPQAVTYTWLQADVARPRRIRLQFLSEAMDGRPQLAQPLVIWQFTPHFANEAPLGEEPPGVGGKDLQQFVLGVGQFD